MRCSTVQCSVIPAMNEQSWHQPGVSHCVLVTGGNTLLHYITLLHCNTAVYTLLHYITLLHCNTAFYTLLYYFVTNCTAGRIASIWYKYLVQFVLCTSWSNVFRTRYFLVTFFVSSLFFQRVNTTLPALYCKALYYALHCTAQHCTTLHCTVLH